MHQLDAEAGIPHFKKKDHTFAFMRNWSSKLFENQSNHRAERIVSETNKS
jgi:hypothetical protein